MVYRVCVEKKPGLAPECASLLSDCRSFLDLKSLESVRIWNRYDVEGIDETLFAYATNTVFSEPQLDLTSGEIDASGAAAVFAVEPLPGQFDQRADSAAQCIQLISQGERPLVRSARVYLLEGALTPEQVAEIKKYVINPVEAREASPASESARFITREVSLLMHDAAYYIQLLLSGVTVGSLYALIAIGYTMVYGILRLINFAHGDIFMMAGFFMVYISATCSLAISIPLVLILTVILGVLIEKAAYKPLRTAPRMSVMISAIGVSYLLQNLATYITGGIARAYPDIPFLTKVIQMGSLSVKRITIITPILTIVLVVALVLLINHTKIGMAMRAVSRDFETSQLMGIKINSVISMTFVIGSFLAGVASILYFANYGQVSPMIGAMPGLKAFVAAVFGGIGSIPGAVIGAFIIGICESFIKANENIAVFSNAFTFALLIIILLCKPNGLFGEKLTEKV